MNAITYNTLIDLFVRVNNMDQAYTLLNDMNDTTLKPDSFTYSTLMKGIKKNVKRLPKERTIEQCFG
jgi:pentatricopeptide repeat protein